MKATTTIFVLISVFIVGIILLTIGIKHNEIDPGNFIWLENHDLKVIESSNGEVESANIACDCPNCTSQFEFHPYYVGERTKGNWTSQEKFDGNQYLGQVINTTVTQDELYRLEGVDNIQITCHLSPLLRASTSQYGDSVQRLFVTIGIFLCGVSGGIVFAKLLGLL